MPISQGQETRSKDLTKALANDDFYHFIDRQAAAYLSTHRHPKPHLYYIIPWQAWYGFAQLIYTIRQCIGAFWGLHTHSLKAPENKREGDPVPECKSGLVITVLFKEREKYVNFFTLENRYMSITHRSTNTVRASTRCG